MLTNKVTSSLVVAVIVSACIGAGFTSMSMSYCKASELELIYGGGNCACESVSDICAGCNGNCTGASDGAECGKTDASTDTWKCKTVEGGGGCNLTGPATIRGKPCKCESASCVQKSGSVECGKGPLSCSTD